MNQKKLPDIIIFMGDQWRSSAMGHLGDPAACTPNLDAVVESDAVSFRHAFCQNPVCTPSRCSFMTGWYPHVRGHRSMHFMLQPDEPCLLKTLKEQGYFVWWGGKNDLIPGQADPTPYRDVRFKLSDENIEKWGHKKAQQNPQAFEQMRGKLGDDTYYSFFVGKVDTGEDTIACNSDYQWVLGALDFIAQAPSDKPLCIYLPLTSPHPPYAVEDPWFSMIDRSKLPPRIPAPGADAGLSEMIGRIAGEQNMQSWSEERWNELRATYYGMCARTDHHFGLVMDALKKKNRYDDAAVFFFSDHGDFTGDYGLVEKNQNSFQDCLSGVPLIVKPPKDTPIKPGVRDCLVELIDFTATVLDIAGIEPDWTHFGKSLVPHFAQEGLIHRDAVFCEGGRLASELQGSEKCALPRENPEAFPYWPRLKWQTGSSSAHGKAVMCRSEKFKYVRRLYERDEFYDLLKDPCETHNEIDNPVYTADIANHKERMLQFFIETGDVLPHKLDQRGG